MTKIVILDVGHGNCAVVHEDKTCLVIDAGPGTALLEFIREQRIEVVEEMLISHADTDHLKGVITLLDQDDITVKSVRLNSDAAKESKQWDALLCSLDDCRRRGEIQFEVQLVEGFMMRFADVALEVLAPSTYLAGRGPGSRDTAGRRVTTNTISAVVRVQMSQNCMDEAPNEDGHLAAVFADGRESGHCCAGSIVLSAASLVPSVAAHTEFVRLRAPRALCGPLD